MFITGYGAYEISSDPGFSVARLSLLDRGVLYAVPHVRGGGEMGRAWYEQGRRLNKRHTFEDFIDVTAALQDAGLAVQRPGRWRTAAPPAAWLMGAIANMAPQLYAGIEADVPFVDALTSILDPSLPLTVARVGRVGRSAARRGRLPVHEIVFAIRKRAGGRGRRGRCGRGVHAVFAEAIVAAVPAYLRHHVDERYARAVRRAAQVGVPTASRRHRCDHQDRSRGRVMAGPRAATSSGAKSATKTPGASPSWA